MNPRTLIIAVGVVVALGAPATAGAKILPTKHVAKHHKIVEHVSKRQGQPLQRAISVSVRVTPTLLNPSELCNQQNEDLIAHALDTVDCSVGEAQSATSEQESIASDPSPAGSEQAAELADSSTVGSTLGTDSQSNTASSFVDPYADEC